MLELGEEFLNRVEVGEYLGSKNSLAPAERMARRTALPLCEPRLMGWTPLTASLCQSGVVVTVLIPTP